MPEAPKLPSIKPAAAAAKPKSSAARGYGHAHKKQRKRKLAENPICERCGEDWAVQLHHRDRNPFNRSASNVEMLCERCHQKEHGGR